MMRAKQIRLLCYSGLSSVKMKSFLARLILVLSCCPLRGSTVAEIPSYSPSIKCSYNQPNRCSIYLVWSLFTLIISNSSSFRRFNIFHSYLHLINISTASTHASITRSSISENPFFSPSKECVSFLYK